MTILGHARLGAVFSAVAVMVVRAAAFPEPPVVAGDVAPHAPGVPPASPVPASPTPLPADAGEAIELDRLAARSPGPAPVAANPFGAMSWRPPPAPPPPPPPPARPAPPPPPVAPPLPFTYLGRYESPPDHVVFLLRGDRMYQVAPGEVIEGTYRFDGMAQGQVNLTYLPLDEKQFLATGETP